MNNNIFSKKKDSYKGKQINKVFKVSIVVFSWLFIGMFASIIIFLFIEGIDGFKVIFKSDKWDFVNNYGVLPLLVGTIFVTLIAILIATPLAICTSLLINEFFPRRIKNFFNSVIELLAGIPSVIYGFFGIMFFIGNHLLSYSVLLAGIILAFMILPNVLHFTNVGISSISSYARDGSIALGANRIETTFKIILPGARKSITAGVMIGIARAIGETIAVTMVIGSASNLPNAHDFFTKFFSMFLLVPNNTISAAIATHFLEATGNQNAILYAIAFVLFALVTFFNISSIIYLNNGLKKFKRFIKKLLKNTKRFINSRGSNHA